MANQKKDLDNKTVLTPEFRVSFPALFEPKTFEGKTTPEYSVVMLFPKETNLGKTPGQKGVSLKEAYVNACIEKWGPKEKWPKGIKHPFRDGDEKADVDGYEGMIFITAKSRTRPVVVDAKVRPILDADDLYAGCYARAQVIASAYDQAGNKGVSFWLTHIQKVRDGDSFGGRRPAEDVFDALETADDDETTTPNGADTAGDDYGLEF